MRCAGTGFGSNLDPNEAAHPRTLADPAREVVPMENIRTQLPVTQTCSVSARPWAVSREFGVVKAGVVALYQGTGMPFGAGADGALTPSARINPSGTTTWSPPV